METSEILQLVLSTPLSAILFYMLVKEQNAHAETRKQRDSENREWAKLLLQMTLGTRIDAFGGMTEQQVLTRLENL